MTYQLIGFVPQQSMAIYKNGKTHFSITTPFRSFSVEELKESFNLESLPLIYEDVVFSNFQTLTSYLKKWHFYEVMKNVNTSKQSLAADTTFEQLQENTKLKEEILAQKREIQSLKARLSPRKTNIVRRKFRAGSKRKKIQTETSPSTTKKSKPED